MHLNKELKWENISLGSHGNTTLSDLESFKIPGYTLIKTHLKKAICLFFSGLLSTTHWPNDSKGKESLKQSYSEKSKLVRLRTQERQWEESQLLRAGTGLMLICGHEISCYYIACSWFYAMHHLKTAILCLLSLCLLSGHLELQPSILSSQVVREIASIV